MRLYTIGYGNRTPQAFLSLLETHHIGLLVDVRLRPDRARLGAYAKANTPQRGIQRWLAEHQVTYVSLVELGNVFMGCDDWRERYHRLLQRAGDVLTARLLDLPTPFCLMCAERQAAACHRGLLADYLARRGYDVHHIV